MAPRGRRAEDNEPEAFHELGHRGRKTGISLPDRGNRDAHGMQPLEDIFSSPRKGNATAGSGDDSGSEDMDIASSAGPGPRTLLKSQRNIQYPIPRSRSPLKTNLKSPARRNPHLEQLSSPRRASAEKGTVRKLNFASKPKAGGRRINGFSNVVEEEEEEDEEDEMDAAMGGDDDGDLMDMLEQSVQMVDDMADSADEAEDELPVVKAPISAKRGRGRPKAVLAPVREPSELPSFDDDPPEQEEEEVEEEEEEAPVQRRRGRPAKARPAEERETTKPSKKRRSLRDSTGDEEQEEEEPSDLRQNKRQRTESVAPPTVKRGRGRPASASKTEKPAKPRPKGRPAKIQAQDSDDAGETSFMALQRGPPMPRSRGLVSVRHEEDVGQTRSGRHSYRPVDYWRGEEVVLDEESQHGGDFVLPTIKEIVRVAEDTLPSKRAPQSKSRAKSKTKGKSRATTQVIEEDEELEEWEISPGTIAGEVVLWEPEHEHFPPAEDEPITIAQEQLAISADAIETRDIRDATFRFAKTLTLPFMGAGVVDLPPGAEKRPKNSRKMQMVFFVHFGKVMVTVNEAQFRITAGGMWFVPRGNYYSITNDYENPARVFFSQACEVAPQSNEDVTNQSIAG